MILKVKDENGHFKEVILKGTRGEKGDKGDRGEDGTVLQQKEIDNIKSSLDNIDHKVKEPITLNRCDEEMLKAIEGGEGTNFELLSVPRDNSVDGGKFNEEFAKYFNGKIQSFQLGYIETNGNIGLQAPTTITSNLVYLNVGTKVKIDDKTTNIYRYARYSNGAFIERHQPNTKEITIATSGYYRIQLFSAHPEIDYTDRLNEFVSKMKYEYLNTIVTDENIKECSKELFKGFLDKIVPYLPRLERRIPSVLNCLIQS